VEFKWSEDNAISFACNIFLIIKQILVARRLMKNNMLINQHFPARKEKVSFINKWNGTLSFGNNNSLWIHPYNLYKYKVFVNINSIGILTKY
jgi:hypothetical protein